jgi:hypothetical protein
MPPAAEQRFSEDAIVMKQEIKAAAAEWLCGLLIGLTPLMAHAHPACHRR